MNIEIREAVEVPVQTQEPITLNGQECGWVKRANKAEFYCHLRIEYSKLCPDIYAGGFGETREAAVEEALDNLREQVVAIEKFLEAAQ